MTNHPAGSALSTVTVDVPEDVQRLQEHWHVTLEPPYWYLTCRFCDRREYLPWDVRLRTPSAVDMLHRHGRDCAESFE